MNSLPKGYRFLFIGFLIIVLLRALFAYTWHSEFWSILLAKQFFNPDPYNSSVYISPLFHMILGFVYFVPSSSLVHILLSKSLFAILGVLVVFLFWKKLGKNVSGLLLTVLCFSNPFVLNEIGRVRADWLAVFFILLFFERATFKSVLFSILSTPKSIFMLMISLLSTPFNKAKLRFKPLLPYFGIVVALVLLLSFQFYRVAIQGAFNYFIQSYSAEVFNIKSFYHFRNLLMVSSLQILFISYIIFKNKVKLDIDSFKKIFRLTTIFLLIIILFSQKNSYFISCLWVIFSYEIFRILQQRNIVFKFNFVLSVIIIAQLVFSVLDIYRHNSLSQFYFIGKLEKILKDHPELSVFDSMGLLPKRQNLVGHMSNEEDQSSLNTIERVKRQKPEILIRSIRTLAFDEQMKNIYDEDYAGVGPDIYLRALKYSAGLSIETKMLFAKLDTLYRKKVQQVIFRSGQWSSEGADLIKVSCNNQEKYLWKREELLNCQYLQFNQDTKVCLNIDIGSQERWKQSSYSAFAPKYWWKF